MFKTCELRCHQLDRTDQYKGVLSAIEHMTFDAAKIRADITALQEKLAALDIQIRKRASFAKLVESTLHIHWIDNPEVLEATWLQNEDWLKGHH